MSVSAQSSAQPSLARSSPALEAGTRQAASRMWGTVLASLLHTASSYSILRGRVVTKHQSTANAV